MAQGFAPWALGRSGLNPYFAFTDACNARHPLVILASGQACVWYRLTLASKDGDWIIAENSEACSVVIAQLQLQGAKYRLGAPLHPRWLAAGWSSHFEAIQGDGTRLRFDFVSRPPRIDPIALTALWGRVHAGSPAVVDPETLIRLKQTLRLKDYPFIGALASKLPDPESQIRWTIDPAHLQGLISAHPELMPTLVQHRPVVAEILQRASRDEDALAVAIDGEIRSWRRADDQRITRYTRAIEPWSRRFRELDLQTMPLTAAHACMIESASGILPEDL
jgi:hypothetical protein